MSREQDQVAKSKAADALEDALMQALSAGLSPAWIVSEVEYILDRVEGGDA